MKPIQVIVLLSLLGCVQEPDISVGPIEGYVPVYGEKSLAEIKLSPSRTIIDPGKIYTYQNFLFVNEHNLGAHVFDNQNPAQPLPIAFIEILGNNDIAIKDDIMYADHIGNIVALKLNELKNLEHLASLPLSGWLIGIPPPGGAYFECIDSEKGLIVAWRKETLNNQDCYAF